MGKMKELKMDIESVLSEYLFEVNDVVTRHAIWAGLMEVLPEGMRVICDETNNPLQTIMKNELHIEIVGLCKIVMNESEINYGY